MIYFQSLYFIAKTLSTIWYLNQFKSYCQNYKEKQMTILNKKSNILAVYKRNII